MDPQIIHAIGAGCAVVSAIATGVNTYLLLRVRLAILTSERRQDDRNAKRYYSRELIDEKLRVNEEKLRLMRIEFGRRTA